MPVLLLWCASYPPTGTTVGKDTSVAPWFGGWGLVGLGRVGHINSNEKSNADDAAQNSLRSQESHGL